jgi:O-antigen/teichoic acid export membrane protein
MMIKGSLSLVALGVAVLITGNVAWGAFALALSWAGILCTYDVRSAALILDIGRLSWLNLLPSALRPRFDSATLRRLAWLALPLGVVMMFNSLDANLPRYFVEHDRGSSGLGIYAAVAYLLVAGNTVVLALGQSASPRLARYYAAGSGKSYRTLLIKTLLVGVTLGGAGIVLSILAGRLILTLLYKPIYGSHSDVFVWLMVAASFTYLSSLIGVGMTSARYFRIQAPLLGVVTVVLAGACAFLVPRMHLLGAAYATVLAMSVQLLLSVLVVGWALRALHTPTRRAQSG